MNRRHFLASSIATPLIAGSAFGAAIGSQEEKPGGREYYELRMYHLRRGPKQKLFDDFFREVSLPAMSCWALPPVPAAAAVVPCEGALP